MSSGVNAAGKTHYLSGEIDRGETLEISLTKGVKEISLTH